MPLPLSPDVLGQITGEEKVLAEQAYTVLDLFCGAGGLSLGFAQANFHVVCAVDREEAAVTTYNNNFRHSAILADLSASVSLPETDLIIGGPPCQGFSSAGLRRRDDHRNGLVGRFAEYVRQLQPRAFVFENVEGFLTAQGGEQVTTLLLPLIEAGYRIHLRKVNSANYGVPQHRKRVIAIGGLGWDPSFPMPTHSAFGAPGAHLAATDLPLTPTLDETLRTLPSPTTEAPGHPLGHYYRPLSEVDYARAAVLKPGQTMRNLPDELRHESYQRRAFRRVQDGTPTERRGGAPTGVRRLRGDEPAKAITGGANAEFVHPWEHRPLTLRECARLQTFPDDFVFCGTASQQAQLIGNAVPPQLARIIAESIARDFSSAKHTNSRGALLSFVPTLSNGYSPILKQVNNDVRAKFWGDSEGWH